MGTTLRIIRATTRVWRIRLGERCKLLIRHDFDHSSLPKTCAEVSKLGGIGREMVGRRPAQERLPESEDPDRMHEFVPPGDDGTARCGRASRIALVAAACPEELDRHQRCVKYRHERERGHRPPEAARRIRSRRTQQRPRGQQQHESRLRPCHARPLHRRGDARRIAARPGTIIGRDGRRRNGRDLPVRCSAIPPRGIPIIGGHGSRRTRNRSPS